MIKSGLCSSRMEHVECTIDWMMMPPLCRPDDLGDKNDKITASRQVKTEAAGLSSADAGDAHDDNDPLNPEGVDYSV